jgi:putative ABC transport system permease protein
MQILVLLMKIFAKLLLIACIVGVPIAWYLSSKWLEGFVYRTPLGVMVFVASILIIVSITLLTVGYESLKASLTNPVKALKHE